MFSKLLGKFSKDLGIDLGTANTLVYVAGRGIVINEPSVVAINSKTGDILAVGEEARRMIGKTPQHITVTRPLIDGIISDFEVTEKMLKYFIDKVHRETPSLAPRPRVVIGIPQDVTEVEKKAVEDAATSAGAREVFLIEETMAAAIGARMPVEDSIGNMVVDIGGGTTEVSVIALGGAVAWKVLKIAGDEMTQDIIQYARENFNLLLGETSAEEVKKQIGSVFPQEKPLTAKMRGRDLITGLPREIKVTDSDVREALSRSINILIENVKSTMEVTPPELAADIYQRGLVLTGGGALLKGLGDLITFETKIPVTVAEDPLTTVARGTGIVLEDLDNLKNIIVPSAKAEIS